MAEGQGMAGMWCRGRDLEERGQECYRKREKTARTKQHSQRDKATKGQAGVNVGRSGRMLMQWTYVKCT